MPNIYNKAICHLYPKKVFIIIHMRYGAIVLSIIWLLLWSIIEFIMFPFFSWAFLLSLMLIISLVVMITFSNTRKRYYFNCGIASLFLCVGFFRTSTDAQYISLCFLVQWGISVLVTGLSEFSNKSSFSYSRQDVLGITIGILPFLIIMVWCMVI